MAVSYKQCPKCGSKNSLEIIHGIRPSLQEAEAGKVKLGGYSIIEGGPEHFCEDCNNEWNQEQAIDSAYSKIIAIKASVGGYFGGYYNVEIELNNLKTTWTHGGHGKEEETIHKKIRAATATRFIEQMKMVDLLNWKSKYIEPGVCDGTQWGVEIVTDVRTISKYGDNKFPDEWDMFCKSVSSLTGRKFK